MQSCCYMCLVDRLVAVKLLCHLLNYKNFQLGIPQPRVRLILQGNNIHLRIFLKDLRFQPPHNRNQECSLSILRQSKHLYSLDTLLLGIYLLKSFLRGSSCQRDICFRLSCQWVSDFLPCHYSSIQHYIWCWAES